MRHHQFRIFQDKGAAVLLAMGFVFLAFPSAAIWGENDPPVVETGRFNSSLECGKCHTEIYSMWKRSLHANSVTDPIFEASYSLAYRYTAGKAKELCLKCHAPLAHYSRDYDLKEAISNEGISCDFCHSVASVDLENRDQPYRVSLDGIKRGPLHSTTSPAHRVAESSLHGSSEFCAGCHEYRNPEGLSIFSTYSEWKVSPQAKQGITCQVCHMPAERGRTVSEGYEASSNTVNLHNISGGHSSEQVRKAARIRIVDVSHKKPDLASIQIEVANVGSGHYIPTGMPTRKLVLDVDVFADQRKVTTLRRVYQRILADGEGKAITEDYRVLLDAKSLISDNRLRPGEKRLEQFVVDVPPGLRIQAKARLSYLYEPLLLSPTRMTIAISSDEQ